MISFINSTDSYDLIEYKISNNTTLHNNLIKIAGFDLDSTIITTKSKRTFAIDCNDWKFKYSNIKDKFEELIKNGYKIVIITNQLGISTGKTKKEDLIEKITNISKELNINLTWLTLYNDNLYRKPRVKSFELFENIENVNKNNSFYCGDAAGRVNDFSDTDYKYAINLNIKFYSDTYFFTGRDDRSEYSLTVKPTSLIKEDENIENKIKKKDNTREVIILIGSPSSGKSSLCNLYFLTYKIINQDTLKTVARCKKELINLIENTQFDIIIDNTNRNIKTRKVWIDLINKYNIPIRYIFIDIPKILALHINTYRSLTTEKKIPKIAIHAFYKQLEIPSDEEVDNICKISFNLNEDLLDMDLFNMYLF